MRSQSKTADGRISLKRRLEGDSGLPEKSLADGGTLSPQRSGGCRTAFQQRIRQSLFMALGALVPFSFAKCESHAGVVHVSPQGNDAAEGSRDHPLATVEKALTLLPDGGTIVLREGVYRESVTLPEREGGAPLAIRAEQGETVVFDGGEAISGWESWKGKPGLYAARVAGGEAFTQHLWDPLKRYRYLRHMDAEGVRAWPGSFCLLEEGLMLVHSFDGEKPSGLKRNRESRGIVVLRDNVSVHGIQFRNYFLNQYAAAVGVGAVRDVEIADCAMENAFSGVRISAGAENVSMVRCRMRDIGIGVANSGNAITVRDSLFESAAGNFKIHELLPVVNCAIRLYHPGQGALVSGCVAAGFHYGLRIKTGENSGEQLDRAFVIEHNTFPDGVSITQGSQSPHDRYACNIFGDAGKGLLESLQARSATVESNYLIGAESAGGTADLGDNNWMGPDPFVDLPKGNLNIRPGVELPVCGEAVAGAKAKSFKWTPEVARELAGEVLAGSQKTPEATPAAAEPRAAAAPRLIHVRADTATEGADGSEEHPFPVLQAALNVVQPGDTVLLGDGVYVGTAVLLQSGTREAPITIRGAGETETFLDGGRKFGVLLELIGVRHVIVRDMQFRWFEEAGVAARGCGDITIERCRFINMEIASGSSAPGAGVLLERSPNCTISHCIVTRTRFGFRILRSPGVTLQNNTAFKNLNTSAELNRSSRNAKITGNSFTFSSHSPIYIWEPDRTAFATMVLDFNNYGNRLYDYRQNGKPVKAIEPPTRYGRVASGKGVVEVMLSEMDTQSRKRFHNLEEWQRFSRQDAHSIFADPQYADPVRGDFRVLAGSPNVLAGYTVIGAAASMVEKTR